MECADVCCDTYRVIKILDQLELGLQGELLFSWVIQDQKSGCEYYSGVNKPEVNVSSECLNLSSVCLWWLQSQQSRLKYLSDCREPLVILASKNLEIRDV